MRGPELVVRLLAAGTTLLTGPHGAWASKIPGHVFTVQVRAGAPRDGKLVVPQGSIGKASHSQQV